MDVLVDRRVADEAGDAELITARKENGADVAKSCKLRRPSRKATLWSAAC
ncbi:hypothetical protein [Rhizobium brockwellii]